MATWASTGNEMACGTVDITIQYPIGSAISFQCLEISGIKYEFDLPENAEESRSIGAIIGDSSITLHDVSDDGQSIYDLLSDPNAAYEITGDPTNYKAKIEVTTYAGQPYAFDFYFTKAEVSTDDLARKTSIKLRPMRATEELVSDYFNGDIEDSSGTAITTGVGVNAYDAYESTVGSARGNKVVFAADFIRDILKTVNASNSFLLKTTDPYLKLSSNASSGDVVALIADDSVFATGSTLDLTFIDSSDVCFEVVGAMAALQGCIYGSGFNVNFFVNRLDTSDNVSVSQSQVEDLEIETTMRQWKYISVSYSGSASTTQYNYAAAKNFLYLMPLPNDAQGRFINSGYRGTFNGSSFASTASYVSHDASNAVNAYGRALGASGESMINITVFGFDTIKPYQTFYLDDTFPSRYRGRTFRVSSAEYSFDSDNIKIKAYQVA